MSDHFFDREYPKARKQYRCDLCGEHILKGEKHCRTPMVLDGTRQASRLHNRCERLCDTYSSEANPRDDEYGFDSIQEWAYDNGLWPPEEAKSDA